MSLDVNGLIDIETGHFRDEEYIEFGKRVKENGLRLPVLMKTEGLVYKRTGLYNGEPQCPEFSWKLWVPVSHGGFHI